MAIAALVTTICDGHHVWQEIFGLQQVKGKTRQAMDRLDELIAKLAPDTLLRALEPAQLQTLLRSAARRDLKPGEAIITQGDEDGDFAVCLISGGLKISMTSPGGREIILNYCSPGEIVGEIAMLDNTRTQTPALLKGLIFTDRGIAMTPTVTKKGSRHYRYYTSMDAIRNRACEGRDSFVRLNAGMVESAVVQHIRSLLRTPEITARAVEAVRRTDPDMNEQDVVTALVGFDSLWESLFPAEQARIARLLIERVTVSADGLAVDLRTEGLGSVVREMVTPKQELAA